GLGAGDSYEIRDAQNFFGTPVVTGTYGGSSVNIPLNTATVSPTVGSFNYPPVHTDKEFGSFVLRKTASASTPTPTPVAGDLNTDHVVNVLDYSLLNSKWLQ